MLAKFVNVLMRKGKKSTAEAICYKALDRIQEKTKGDPIVVFKKAVENLKPSLEVKSRRVGGASYQVPIEVKQPRRLSLAFRWLRLYASQRPEKSMVDKLAGEILDASIIRVQKEKKTTSYTKLPSPTIAGKSSSRSGGSFG
jgi:small subunit ribosomal protein S7